jgi:hypothetical protein
VLSLTHLACRVNNLGCEVLSLVAYDFGKGVLDSRVVGLDEVAVDIANGERGLACEVKKST